VLIQYRGKQEKCKILRSVVGLCLIFANLKRCKKVQGSIRSRSLKAFEFLHVPYLIYLIEVLILYFYRLFCNAQFLALKPQHVFCTVPTENSFYFPITLLLFLMTEDFISCEFRIRSLCVKLKGINFQKAVT